MNNQTLQDEISALERDLLEQDLKLHRKQFELQKKTT